MWRDMQSYHRCSQVIHSHSHAVPGLETTNPDGAQRFNSHSLIFSIINEGVSPGNTNSDEGASPEGIIITNGGGSPEIINRKDGSEGEGQIVEKEEEESAALVKLGEEEGKEESEIVVKQEEEEDGVPVKLEEAEKEEVEKSVEENRLAIVPGPEQSFHTVGSAADEETKLLREELESLRNRVHAADDKSIKADKKIEELEKHASSASGELKVLSEAYGKVEKELEKTKERATELLDSCAIQNQRYAGLEKIHEASKKTHEKEKESWKEMQDRDRVAFEDRILAARSKEG